MSTGFKLNKIYQAGYCVIRWTPIRFYTRAFLLEHPKWGLILIDTGYGKALLEATKQGLYSLYKKLLPFTYRPEDSVVAQLAQDGISLNDLSYLLLTHFHPDHIGALPEFAKVPWIYRKEPLDQLLRLSPFQGLRKGFIRPLVPAVPNGSISILESHFSECWHGFASSDLFGDGSLHLIDLPGHAAGQMGVSIQKQLFAADARWGAAPPHPLISLLQEDPKAYRATSRALQQISTQIIQTHV